MSFPTVEIRRRPSLALFAIAAMAMVVGSYMFVLLLAAACVLFPYLFLINAESINVQVLFLFGIVIAGALVWALIPRRHKFERPGMLLDPKAHPRLFAELEASPMR